MGVSRCLLGENVRYDGTHKLNLYIRDQLGRVVQWIPVCPEVECGLSVPREPMQLVNDSGKFQLLSKAQVPRRDYTLQMLQWIERKFVELARKPLVGFVLKARSPSCAIRDAEIWDLSTKSYTYGPGLFTRALLERFPFLVCMDEEALQNPEKQKAFLEKIFYFFKQENR